MKNNLKRKLNHKYGGILLLVMIVMIVFIIMTTYTLRFTILQSHVITNQEEEEKAFAAADSGVSYAAWLLNPDGVNYSLNEIENLDSPINNHAVKDENGNIIGYFSLQGISTNSENQSLQLLSVGRNHNSNKCQTIKATLRQPKEDDPYIITEWNHQVSNQCP